MLEVDERRIAIRCFIPDSHFEYHVNRSGSSCVRHQNALQAVSCLSERLIMHRLVVSLACSLTRVKFVLHSLLTVFVGRHGLCCPNGLSGTFHPPAGDGRLHPEGVSR